MSVSDMMSAKRIKKYRKAFTDAGWQLNPAIKLTSPAPGADLNGPAFYLCDLELGNLTAIRTVEGSIEMASSMMKDFSTEEIVDGLGSFYGDLIRGKVKQSGEASSILTWAACSYISRTAGYRQVLDENMGTMNYLIIRMWDHENNALMLRPVPIQPREFYEPEVIEEIVDEVLEIDRHNHPARFGKGVVLPFKIRS
jgi:hypothetical protein